jgi:hypothetical protein
MIYASSTPSKRERGGIKTGIHVIIMLSDVVSIREILKAKSVLMRSLSPDMLLSDEVEFVDTLERANNALTITPRPLRNGDVNIAALYNLKLLHLRRLVHNSILTLTRTNYALSLSLTPPPTPSPMDSSTSSVSTSDSLFSARSCSPLSVSYGVSDKKGRSEAQ